MMFPFGKDDVPTASNQHNIPTYDSSSDSHEHMVGQDSEAEI